MAKTIKIGGRLESVETGNIVAGANQIIDDDKHKRQSVINGEVDAELVRLDETKQGNLTFDNAPTEDSNNPVKSGGVYAAEKLLSDAIEAILLLIPSAASALNKLVDMQTMNSSIATATATFRGTYNVVSDLELAYNATHEQIAAKLDEVITTADNNDYAFVQIPVSATSQDIAKTERYKFNGEAWAYEYDLNNSGFTQAQWDAINSTITAALVSKLSALPTATDLQTALNGKQDNLTFDLTPTSGSQNPVTSGGIYTRNAEIVALITALDTAKQDVLTFDSTPTQNSSNPVTSNGVYVAVSALQAAIVALDAAKQNVLTFDSTPTLGSNNPVTSSGIKTELNRIDGDITTLDNLYQALTQSALMIVQPTDTWPVSNPNTTTIYRVVDRVNTPPQYYSDYMWNGTSMVQMAQYNNAIDDVPTEWSDNLVKSGGVKKEIGGEARTGTYNNTNFANIIWDGEKFVNSSSSYNSFIFHVNKGQKIQLITFTNCAFQNGLVFENRPALGAYAQPLTNMTSLDYTAQDDCYIMVTIKNYNSSATLQYLLGSYGLIKRTEKNEADIVIINGEIEKLNDNFLGKKVLCLGDSVMSFFYEDDKNVPDFIASYSQATVYNGAVGGIRWAPRLGAATFPNQESKSWNCLDLANLVKAWIDNDFTNVDEAVRLLNTYYDTSATSVAGRNRMVSTLKSVRPSQVDAIIIMCGGNDLTGNTVIGQLGSTTITELYGAINSVISDIFTENPAVKVYLFGNIVKWIGYSDGTGDPSNFSDNYTNGNGDKMEDINDAIKNGAKKYKLPFCDMYDTLGWNMLNFSTYFGQNDGSHPYLGRDIIARKMFAFVSSNRLIP